MATVTGTSKAQCSPSLSVANDLANLTWAPNYSKTITWASGVAANQVNEVFAEDRTLAANTNEDLDLTGVMLQNPGGTNIAFARVKELLIVNLSATQTLTVGGAASFAWVGPFGATTHTIKVEAGGFLHLVAPTAAGWPVTAGTADLLRVANNAGASCDYRIMILGGLT